MRNFILAMALAAVFNFIPGIYTGETAKSTAETTEEETTADESDKEWKQKKHQELFSKSYASGAVWAEGSFPGCKYSELGDMLYCEGSYFQVMVPVDEDFTPNEALDDILDSVSYGALFLKIMEYEFISVKYVRPDGIVIADITLKRVGTVYEVAGISCDVDCYIDMIKALSDR